MSSISTEQRLRKLTIKTNVVKRISKDKLKYEEELRDLMRSLEEKKASQSDEYVIKKMDELIDEAKMMVADCSNRLSRALSDLDGEINDCEDLTEYEQFLAAKNIAIEQCAGDS